MDTVFKCTLRNSLQLGDYVQFEATPDISETRNVNYKSVDPIHAPGQIMSYINTSSRSFNLSSVKFISRTSQEATDNLDRLWVLRGWTMPRFGTSTLGGKQRFNRNQQAAANDARAAGRTIQASTLEAAIQGENNFGTERRGEPPAVLLLSAYSSDSYAGVNFQDGKNFERQHINRVPVVIQNLNIQYPSDVAYIPDNNGTPMPTIMSVDMTLIETHSPRQYENFNLEDYKTGVLPGF